MAVIDDLQNGADSPAAGVLAITPSDSISLPRITRGVYVGGAGSVSALMADGTSAVFAGVQAGSLLPLRATRINATGTTATLILALY